MSRPEEELFAEYARTGAPHALGAVYDRLAPELFRVALHLARSPAEAEDVLQATFLAAIERAAAYDPARPLLPWLTGILANQARRARRLTARAPEAERLERPAPRRPDEESVELELDAHVGRALLAVPEAFRAVVILRVRHQLTVPEIAAALGRPPGTVRSQLQRGLEHVRRRLPASYAGAFLGIAVSERGLGAVKEAVLAGARAAEAAFASGGAGAVGVGGAGGAAEAASGAVPFASATIAGVLVMKKAVLAAVLLVALGVGWRVVATGRGAARVPRPAAPAERAAVEAAELDPTDEVAFEAASAARGEVAVASAAPAATEPAPADEAPATGALVVRATHAASGAPAEGFLVLVDAHARPLPYADPRVARTDAAGSARFDALPAGYVVVRLLRGGEESVPVRAGRTSEVALAVRAGVTVTGEVVDAQGVGVAGAEVWLSERWLEDVGHVVTTADRAGRFVLAAVSADQVLGARAPGYAPSHLQRVQGKDGDALEVRLVLERPGAALAGRVLDLDGAPVAGAVVALGDDRAPRTLRLADGGFATPPPPARGHTDAEGRFALAAVALGEQPIVVRAPGFAAYVGTVAVVEGAAPVEVVLAPEAQVRGRVLDADGKPVAAAWVHTLEPDRLRASRTSSGLDGTYTLAGLAAGACVVVAEEAARGRVEVELELDAGETVERDLVLARVPRFFGTVMDAHGDPLAGWTVVAFVESAGVGRARSQATDAAGRFAIGEVADAPHTLWVQGPGAWRAFPRLVLSGVAPGGPLELRVPELEATTGTVVAEVVDAAGAPATGAELGIWHAELRIWRGAVVDSKTGALEVAGVPPGTCSFEVKSESHPWLRLGEREVVAGRTLDLGRLELEAAGTLAGNLIGCPAEALETLTFVLVDARLHENGVVRRTGTSFETGPLAAGEYELWVQGEGVCHAEVAFTIEAGARRRRDVALEPAGVRRAVFEAPAHARAPRNLWVELRDAAGRRVWMAGNVLADGGELAVAVSAKPGTYRLVARTNNELEARGDFVVRGYERDPEPAVFRLGRSGE